MIQHFVNGVLAHWVNYLGNLEFASNSSVSETTTVSSFELNYFHVPRDPFDLLRESSFYCC